MQTTRRHGVVRARARSSQAAPCPHGRTRITSIASPRLAWRRSVRCIVLAGTLAAPAMPVAAQTGVIPGPLQPGRNLPERAPDALRADDPRVLPAPVRTRQSLAQIDPRRTARIERVVLEGNSVLPADAVEAITGPLAGREVTGAELLRAAARLTALQVERGYVLSEVVAPEQDLAGGTARLVAIEGRVAQVVFRASGRPVADGSALAAYGANIVRSRPLRRDVLERNLLLMNEVGDALALPTLEPSPDVPGLWDLVVEVGQKRWSGNVAMTNRGSRWLGPARLAAELQYNADFLGGARTGVRTLTTLDRELDVGTLAHEQLLGTSGTKLLVAATSATSRPDVPVAITGGPLFVRSSGASAAVVVPVVRSRDWNLAVRAGGSAFRGTSTIATTRASDDRIDAARVGIAIDGIDRAAGVNLLDVEGSAGRLRCGEDDTGRALCSRGLPRDDRGFRKVNVYAARLQSLGGSWSLLLAATGQWSPDALAVPEQFGFGGEQFGRAFDPGELLGDSGFGLKAELRVNVRMPIVEWPATAYVFHDSGRVWRHASPALGTAAAVAASTADGRAAGTGLRVQLKGSWAGYAEVAKPIGLDVASEAGRPVRVFGGLSWSF